MDSTQSALAADHISAEASDDVLVALAREGRADAFRVLVERHSRAIYRLTYRMTGNDQDAEDLVQETLLRACKQLHRYDGRASFATWLYRIASNCSLDLLRSSKSRQRRIVPIAPHQAGDDGPLLEDFPASGPSPEAVTLAREITRHLAPAMHQLTPQERAAFTLRHLEGFSIEEIGQTLNIRRNAAKHSVFRAVQKLRRVLEPIFRQHAPGTTL